MTSTLRYATVAVLVMVAMAVPAVPAGAQPGCVAEVEGVNVEQYRGWRSPLRVAEGDVLRVAGQAPTPVSAVRASVVLPLASTEVWHATAPRPTRSWAGNLPVDDVARLSSGLHQVEIVAGPCAASIWLDVDGGSPLTTPVLLVSLLLLAMGIGGLAFALRRAVAGRRALAGSALAGALAGGGALLLANQLGHVPLTGGWLTSWLLVPGAIGTVLDLAVTSAARSTPVPVEPPPPPSAGHRPTSAGAPAGDAVRAEPPAMAEPPTARAAGADREVDPPRTSYARIEAPDAVVVEVPFEVTVGLSPSPVEGVAGGEVVRPPTSRGAYDLTVQVIADGFTISDRDARRVLRVTADDPYPAYTPTLTPVRTSNDIAARSIQVIYSLDGQTIGFGVRPIAVVARPELLGAAPAVPAGEPSAMGVPPPDTAPDLTIRLVRGAERPGRLLWTVESPHASVPRPAQPAVSDIGDAPETFARKLVAGVGRLDSTDGVESFLRGVGLTVTDHVPIEITDALTAAAAVVGDRPLSVFLLSEEPYVPWELALLDPPLRDGAPFLGAQTDLGRWVLGQRRPTLPPPLDVTVHSIATIGGAYDDAAQRLLEAEAEIAALVERYAAVEVEARAGAIIDCLGGTPEADVLHFALHGIYDAASMKEGLVLLDGSLLDPLQVKGAQVRGTPFVFLNACQVGSGNELLGDYAGIAQSFLYAGAAGVIAPLWSVNDVHARELATAFYASTLEDGARPAAALREARATFDHGGTGPAAASQLAYQFFGHPRLTLRRSTR